MVLSLLLARAGVEVTVLEKHADFLRDFRGDTVHPSTLTLLDELGLGEQLDALHPRYIEEAAVQLDTGSYPLVDLRRLPGRHPHIALVPQWDFLDLIADACREEPTHRLEMEAEVTGLLREQSRVVGVRCRRGGADTELRADLVVACDGRGSTVRESAGLRPRSFGVPMDVWWFRVPRRDDDPAGGVGRVSRGMMLVLIDRGAYFQIAFLIRKGTDQQLRAQGVERFKARLAEALPWLADRLDTITSLDDVKLLTVQLSRLRRWFAPGLLLIGDAAHAMSPVGGVGINLAVQDAVAAGRMVGPALAGGRLRSVALARVQARRWWPTVVTQGVQRLAHHVLLTAGPLDDQPGAPTRPGLLINAAGRIPALRTIPAYVIGIGVLPEHAPRWARRASRQQRPGASVPAQ
jgi:2-polyprenyl-6-methoxyphenol hydroxylase-like FAD-dependent oxidoreductase